MLLLDNRPSWGHRTQSGDDVGLLQFSLEGVTIDLPDAEDLEILHAVARSLKMAGDWLLPLVPDIGQVLSCTGFQGAAGLPYI